MHVHKENGSHKLPKISVVMPVLNREDTLEKAIRSVIDQQYENIEFIILDGGSTDKTIEIIKHYEQHLTYWHSKPDAGAPDATNRGIEKATGDLVTIFMADDWYEPGIFQKMGEAYQANPDADIFTCAGRIVQYDENTASYQALLTYSTAKQLNLSLYNVCFAVSAICCRFIKKSLYDRIGLFVPFDSAGKLFLTNDKEFLLRAIFHHAKDVFVNQIGHTYFAHKESFSFSRNRRHAMKHCQEHMEIAETYLKKKNVSKRQKFFLMYWYNDQSARLFLYHLLSGDFFPAMVTAKNGLKRYHVIWPVIFIYTFVKITIKKILRLLFNRYAQAKTESPVLTK